MSKHTPGVWSAWRSPHQYWVVKAVYQDDHERRCTAFVAVVDCSAQDEANARLIAAAPDLLAALQSLLEEDIYADGEGLVHFTDEDAAAKARTAIAKAEGNT